MLLIKKLINIEYEEGKPVNEHLGEFYDLINQMTTTKLAFDEEFQIVQGFIFIIYL